MTLWVHDNAQVTQVITDLHKICSDPGLQIDIFFTPGTSTVPGKRGTGEVTFKAPPPAPRLIGCDVLWRLVTSPCRVLIRGETTGFSTWPTAGSTLRQQGGDTVWNVYPGTTEVEIVYDAIACNGKGYWVESAPGTKMAEPTDVLLLHELAHALDLCSGALPANLDTDASAVATAEAQAIVVENQYRASQGATARVGHSGGGYCTATSTSSGPIQKTGGSCFIATAAYGSEIEPEVEFLRRFRDDVLRRTRSGGEFFDDYYDNYYYRLSPPIAEEMHRDAKLREIIRWSLVSPVVEYLRLVVSFPDAPLDDVPEPWRTFLLGQRDGLEQWASALELPLDLQGLSSSDAVDELDVFLRYVLRTPETRARYLDRLEELGQIPLGGCGCDRNTLAARLRESGRSEAEIERVLGAAKAAPRRGLTAFGDHLGSQARFKADEWFYTVTITNNYEVGGVPLVLEEIALAYKRKNLDGVVFLTEPQVAPGETRVFKLGVCSQMEKYAFKAFAYQEVDGVLTEEEIASLPDVTPEDVTDIHQQDVFPCEDSWSIEYIP